MGEEATNSIVILLALGPPFFFWHRPSIVYLVFCLFFVMVVCTGAAKIGTKSILLMYVTPTSVCYGHAIPHSTALIIS